tara:strand:+ start:193 stop:780 length:588 start_codon:yes stop_codon:yes gene_type:complete
MDLRLVFFATYEMILSIIFGLLTIYLVNKMLNWTLLSSDSENAMAKGNIALAIFAGTIVVCNLILVQPSILPSISTLQTMLIGKEEIDIGLLLVSFGFFLVFYFVTMLLSFGVLIAATWLYLQVTVNVDEIKEIRANNIAVSIMLSLVIVGMTLFIQPSLNRFVASFVRYDTSFIQEDIELEEGEVLPMKKISPE